MFIFLTLAGELAGLFTMLAALINYGEFTFLWVLPAAFMLVFPLYMYMAQKSRYSFFYFIFSGATGIRYVAHPLLVALLRDYNESAIQTQVSPADMNEAVWLMVYELLVCTVVVFLIFSVISKNEKRNAERFGWQDGRFNFVFPKKTGFYWVFVIGTAGLAALFPKALSFFSFAIFSFSGVASSALNLFEQGTVVCIIAAKYIAFLLIMMWCKAKREKTGRKVFALIALAATLLFGCFYYGINRMVFIFTFVSAIILYRYFFKDFWSLILIGGAGVGAVVLAYATKQRNYYDFYSDVTGFEHTLRSWKLTLNAYVGGVTNVAVSLITKRQFGDRASVSMFFFDLLRPIVGLNKLLPNRNLQASAYYFNEVFFQNLLDPCQIIPTVGHGVYYVGKLLSPLADVLFLSVFGAVEYLRSKTMRVEIFFIFLMITMRMSMMYGINITILNNELSMQVLFPMLIFFINEKIPFGRINPLWKEEGK